MFSTLEGNWDQSARRGRATLASFTLQAFGLSFLLAIPILTVQGPPSLRWTEESPIVVPPAAPASPPEVSQWGAVHPSNIVEGHLQAPSSTPTTIASLHEQGVASSPDVSNLGVIGSFGSDRRGIFGSTGPSVEIFPPPAPSAPSRPIKLSHWSEGNLIFRVQPIYPPIARQARIQGVVELRAIVSKSGTIENLVVVSGHPMLVKSAIEAVKQWRYRPYLLNNDPVEVETEVTVNFVLSGS